jgi:hypothetical protein
MRTRDVARIGGVAMLAAAAAMTPSASSAFRYVGVGAPAPVVAVEDADGRPVAVPAAGRMTVLLFWRAGQALSEDALADLGAMSAELRSKGVDVVAVAEPGATRQQLAARAVPAPRVVRDPDGRAAEAWGVIVTPSTALVMPDGRLAWYLPSRTAAYRSLVSAHLANARGELDDAGLSARAGRMGEVRVAQADTEAAYRRGVSLAREQRWESAAAALEQALRDDPGHFEAGLRLAWVDLERTRWPEALARFERALAARPDHPSARVGRGIAMVRVGRVDEGIRLLEEAVVLNPEPVRGHWELARAYETKGDGARALEHYRWAYQKLLQGRR